MIFKDFVLLLKNCAQLIIYTNRFIQLTTFLFKCSDKFIFYGKRVFRDVIIVQFEGNEPKSTSNL